MLCNCCKSRKKKKLRKSLKKCSNSTLESNGKKNVNYNLWTLCFDRQVAEGVELHRLTDSRVLLILHINPAHFDAHKTPLQLIQGDSLGSHQRRDFWVVDVHLEPHKFAHFTSEHKHGSHKKHKNVNLMTFLC